MCSMVGFGGYLTVISSEATKKTKRLNLIKTLFSQKWKKHNYLNVFFYIPQLLLYYLQIKNNPNLQIMAIY